MLSGSGDDLVSMLLGQLSIDGGRFRAQGDVHSHWMLCVTVEYRLIGDMYSKQMHVLHAPCTMSRTR